MEYKSNGLSLGDGMLNSSSPNQRMLNADNKISVLTDVLSSLSQTETEITIVTFDFDGNGAEIGFFFVLSLAFVLLVLDKLDGRVFRMKVFLMNRYFHLVRNPIIVKSLTILIRMVLWFAVFLPFIALTVWSAGLIVKAANTDDKIGGGICVFLVGLALINFVGNFLRMKWNYFHFDWVNGVYFVLTFIFLTAYQFVAVYLPEQRTVFGINSIFLCANCLIMMMLVFFNSAVTDGSIEDLVRLNVPTAQQSGQQLPDPNRADDFQDEMNKERDNEQYIPTKEDILDIFTIGKPGNTKRGVASAYGPGLQNIFGNLKTTTKRLVSLGLWMFAIAILIVYSYSIRSNFPNDKALGFITMIAIITTDILIFLIQNAKIVQTATPMCFTLILNRFLLIIFGGDYWVYGYILIYLFYGMLLSYMIAKKRFPLEDDVSDFDIENILQEQKPAEPAPATVAAPQGPKVAPTGANKIMDNSLQAISSIDSKVQNRLKLLTQPEVPLLIITLIYVLILLILTLVRPSSIPLPRLQVDIKDVHFFVAWAFIVVLLCAFYTTVAVVRLFNRRRQGLAQRSYFEFKGFMNIKPFRIERYWIYILLNLLCLIAIGIISWWITGSWTTCVIVIFVDLYLLILMNFFTNYINNDYKFLESIDETNLKVKQHNLRLDNMDKEIKDVKGKLQAGGGQGLAGKALIDKANQMLSKITGKPASGATSDDAWAGATNANKNTPKSQIAPITQQNPVGPAKVQVQVKPAAKPDPSTGNSETDQLVHEELKNMKKAGGDDGIYEGGEPENEITELVVDPDEEEVINPKKFRIRYKEVTDWRKSMNFFTAFWKGQLRKNDYQIIYSSMVSLIVLVIGAWLISSASKSYLGITIIVPFAHYQLAAFSQMKTLSTDEPMNILEYICFATAYVIQYGWGVANLYLTYGFFRKKTTDVTYPDPGTYVVVNLIVIPFITSSVSSVLKWTDNKGKLDRFLIGQLVMTLIQGIAMLICAFIYMTYVQGAIISGIILILIYIGFQVYIYQKNDYYMPPFWSNINLLIAVISIIAAFVVSLCVPGFTVFLGFSISTWLLSVLLFVFGFGRIMLDYRNLKQKPIFFSPWVFPIYKFDPKKQDVVKHNLSAICMISSLVIMIAWSILATVWYTPIHVGVSLSIIFEVMLLLLVIFLIQISQLQLKNLANLIDQKILRRAWIEAKVNYVGNRSAFCRQELVTFEEYWQRKNLFRNKVRLVEGRAKLNLEETYEEVQFIPQVTDQDLQGWVDPAVVDMKNELAIYSFLFRLERDIKLSYEYELELIVMYQLLIITYTEVYSEQKKKFLFAFLIERRPILLALDIVINIPSHFSVKIQYAKVIQQIIDLDQDKKKLFNDLREQFIQDQRDLDDKRRAAAGVEDQKADERAKNMANQDSKRKADLKDNKNKPVAQWVDCLEKYQKIREEFKTAGSKFSDPQFTPDGKSLGPNCQNRGVTQWIRASQHPEKTCVLFKDKVNALDVKQGALGDCYFLSAISVLGNDKVFDMIKTTEDEWTKLGCFCVRFFRNDEEEYVVVDDYFPVMNGEGGKLQWAFVSGGDNGDELWPLVLEKAYAKLYGCYQFIEAGKIQYALTDMIQGFPEQMDLKKDAKNLDVFWEKLKALKRQGALMGAGSPENALGDSAINQQGIVQGHAYALLDVREVDDSRLVMLRNPHGAGGAEWLGDWSDSSSNWNQRAKNKLSYIPRDHEDGVFWMDVYDFIQQYSYLYICRILNENMGWKRASLNGEWKGSTAEGLPSRSNPSAKLELNPQFQITITKPCDAFIMLHQNEPDPTSNSTFKGKQNICFVVCSNKGKRVSKMDKDGIVARSGNPTNLATVSSEVLFDTSQTYPTTFTLLVANTNKGTEGEGTFEIKVFSTDKAMTISALP